MPSSMTFDLPPEAFTKETLQKAFSWLQDQSEELRNTIHTSERLVSLYQKSKRLDGREDFMESEKFIHNLKNLTDHKITSRENSERSESDKRSVSLTENGEKNEKWVELDPLSRERVNEVKKRFNLTSDSEAFRFLISLGFEKFMQF